MGVSMDRPGATVATVDAKLLRLRRTRRIVRGHPGQGKQFTLARIPERHQSLWRATLAGLRLLLSGQFEFSLLRGTALRPRSRARRSTAGGSHPGGRAHAR